MTKRHKTSINYLKLPIFAVSRSADTVQTRNIEYEENGVKSIIEVKNGSLSSYHRKLFFCLEYLYLKHNPDFENNFVRTTFKEIQDTLNVKGNNHRKILQALEDLQDVNIKSVVHKKIGDNVEKEEGLKFSIFSYVKWETNINTRDTDTRRYTGHVYIAFQDFHINNLKSNYYRLINFELVRELSNNTVRLFDYLNLKSYFLKDKAFKQKKRVTFEYKKLTDFLLLKFQDRNSYKERQFENQLKELQEKGVIISYKWQHDVCGSCLHLNLSPSINLWETYTPKQVEIEKVEKLTPLENKLKGYGVSPKQRAFIIHNFNEDYIHNKLEQYEYITKNIPHKVKGRGSYIYNSIKDDWTEDSFIDYKEKQEQKELNLLSQKKDKEMQELSNEYEEYANNKCVEYIKTAMTEDERNAIDRLVYEKVKKNKFLSAMTESSKNFYEEIARLKIVRNKIDIPDYETWAKIHKHKKG